VVGDCPPRADGADVTWLLHVGFHKTGSTFLQKRVFSDPEKGFHSPWPVHAYNELVFDLNVFDFDPDQLRRATAPVANDAMRDGLVPVFSHEELSGNPRTDQHASSEYAKRLRASFSDARVLIVIREQRDWIRSYYRYRTQSELDARLVDFLDQPLRGDALFNLGFLRYDLLIRLYQELFGSERVLVLTYEQLSADPQSFVDAIGAFTGIGPIPMSDFGVVRPGLGAATSELKRVANRLAPTVSHSNNTAYLRLVNRATFHIDRWMPSMVERLAADRQRRTIEAQTHRYWAQSNRTTAELTGLDLRTLGYDVADA
jgi:Sulfotransferase domain